MKHLLLLLFFVAPFTLAAQNSVSVKSPDGKLIVTVSNTGGKIFYNLSLNGKTFINDSPLGLVTDIGDFSQNIVLANADIDTVSDSYTINTIKKSDISFVATRAVISFNSDDKPAFDLILMVENNDVAFKYSVKPRGHSLCAVIKQELTGFVLNNDATSFCSPQMKGMTGWERTAPSYEQPYEADAPAGNNGNGAGYVYPALFRNGKHGWILISETGTNSNYCGCRLVNVGGSAYKTEFPQPEEYNGNGTVMPGIPLPGYTPWRTITVGNTLKPIVETTVSWNYVAPLYQPTIKYTYGGGSWSWILGMDESITYDVQKRYIDFSSAMGFCSVLVDNWWDIKIGRDKIEELARYAATKKVGLFLWYNSNGYWNDAPQTPRNIMNNIIARRKEMKWMHDIGIKGIKVDFFGSDKQVTMQLYEEILADANEYGLEVIFHGCTVPRGWERMYPNFVGCEAVLASENLSFSSDHCLKSAYNACMHPFERNATANMDFGGTTFNKYLNFNNDSTQGGGHRVTSDIFEMALGVLYQCPVQHFQLHPDTPQKAADFKVDFLKHLPTTWDDVQFIDGYPGKYIILARRKGNDWYVACVNAQNQTLNRSITLPMLPASGKVKIYSDRKDFGGSVATDNINKKKTFIVSVPENGATIIVYKAE